MPRPAINTDSITNVPATGYSSAAWACGSTPYSEYHTNYVGWSVRKQVPAGVSTKPLVLPYFRPPTPWSVLDWKMVYPGVRSYGVIFTGNTLCQPGDVVSPIYQTVCDPVEWSFTNIPLPQEYSTALRAKAVNGVLESMKEDGSAALGLALLERKQTEALFITTIKRIVNTVHIISNLKGPKAMRSVKNAFSARQSVLRSGGDLSQLTRRERTLMHIPNWYLEVMYGWKPLMMDIHDSMKAVDFYQSENLYRFSKEQKKGMNTRSVSVNGTASSFISASFSGSAPVKEGCHCRVDYSVDTDALPKLSSLGLANPLALTWEILPFSFIVDWFIPLGNWFNLFDATLGKTFIGGTVSQRLRINMDLTAQVTQPGYSTDYSGLPGSIRYFSMNREVLSDFPSPMPPAFKNPCSPTHIAEALSLLATSFGRGSRRGLRV